MPTFGHAADGNFHVNIMFHRADKAEARRARAATGELMKLVVSLGGAISGEHGIGLAKTPYLSLSATPAERTAMLAIKRALDPKGILNPGKIFEPFEVWSIEPQKVHFPWDHK
jgi:glycolate oxidase